MSEVRASARAPQSPAEASLAEEPPAETASMAAAAAATGPDAAGRALRRSVAPTFGYNVASQVLNFGFGVALARLLSPEEFGLLGMTLVLSNVAAVLGNFGLPKALIQAPALTERQLRTTFTLSLAVSAAAALLVVAAAPAMAAFFGQPVVSDLLRLMALNFVLNGLGTVPYALMSRSLQLRELARIDPLAAIAGGLASVALAATGAGAWSLVWGILVASALRLLLYQWHARWRPGLDFAWGEVRPLARYGSGAAGAAFFTTLTANLDLLLVGRVLSSFALGIYMRALRLVSIPQMQFSMVIVRLLFPYLARIQHDLERVRRNVLRVVTATALVTLPSLLLLTFVAPDFIRVVYGPQWTAAVVPLQILCVTGVVKALSVFAGPVLDALGHVRVQAVMQGVYAAVLAAGILVGARWGVVGVAAALGGASLLLGVLALWLLLRATHLPVRAVGAALLPGLIAAIGSLSAAGAVYLTAGDELSAPLRLGSALAAGAAGAFLALEGSGVAGRSEVYRDLRLQLGRGLRNALGWRAAGAS